LISTLMTCGCVGAFLVLGAGAGAFTYVRGNLSRTYQTDYYQAISASKSAAREFKIVITGQTSDGLKTALKGKRADGTPVTFEIQRESARRSRIGVRCGVVGLADRESAEQIHRSIGRRLKQISSSQKTSSPSATAKQSKPAAGSAGTQTPAEKKKALKGDEKAPPLGKNTIFIYYPADEDGIPADALPVLKQVADHMLQTPAARLRIRGYTDSKGTDEYNLMVSQKRAYAIKSHLAALGIAEHRMTAVGLGARNFIASNKTAKLRALNRRVELELY